MKMNNEKEAEKKENKKRRDNFKENNIFFPTIYSFQFVIQNFMVA